jgi:hypothetical protein
MPFLLEYKENAKLLPLEYHGKAKQLAPPSGTQQQGQPSDCSLLNSFLNHFWNTRAKVNDWLFPLEPFLESRQLNLLKNQT